MLRVLQQRRWRLGLLALSLALFAAWNRIASVEDPAAPDPARQLTGQSPTRALAPGPLPAKAADEDESSVSQGSAQARLPPLPAAISPHFAPAAVRHQDLQRLQQDEGFAAFAAELQARANAGDSDAAMTLSDLMGICGVSAEWGSTETEPTGHGLDLYREVGVSEAQIQHLQAFLHFTGRRCARWRTQSGESWWNLAAAWRARALELDHPGAYLDAQDELVYGTPSEEVLARAREMGLELLRRRDPEELTRYADRLATLSPYDPLGFALAACQLNEACAREPDAYTSSPAGVLGLILSAGNALNNFAGPRARLIGERQAQEIVALWRAERSDLILSGRASATPGGG